jgi:hypothetical protein
MSLIYREIYVGCGERQDGRWNVVVIPPGGARDDVRVVQPDLDILEAAEIAWRLRERVREFPQAEGYSADELLALCTRLRETIKLAGTILSSDFPVIQNNPMACRNSRRGGPTEAAAAICFRANSSRSFECASGCRE